MKACFEDGHQSPKKILRGRTPTRSTMGIVLSYFMEKMFGTMPSRILLLGLDGAGKTTTMYKV